MREIDIRDIMRQARGEQYKYPGTANAEIYKNPVTTTLDCSINDID